LIPPSAAPELSVMNGWLNASELAKTSPLEPAVASLTAEPEESTVTTELDAVPPTTSDR
jgi:hypothetical protein